MCKAMRYSALIGGMDGAALDKEFDLVGFQKNLIVVLDAIHCNKLVDKTQKYRKAANLPYTSIRYADIEQYPIGQFNHKYFEYLSRGVWLKAGDSIIIHGEPSKVRLELVSAFGNELIDKGISVLFKEMKEMLQDLLVADSKSLLQSALKPLEDIDVLILDNFELNILSIKEAFILVSLIQTRNEKGGFIFISKTPLENEIISCQDFRLVGQMLTQHIIPCCHQLNFTEFAKGGTDE
jgi:DNA replication protein DnaC